MWLSENYHLQTISEMINEQVKGALISSQVHLNLDSSVLVITHTLGYKADREVSSLSSAIQTEKLRSSESHSATRSGNQWSQLPSGTAETH